MYWLTWCLQGLFVRNGVNYKGVCHQHAGRRLLVHSSSACSERSRPASLSSIVIIFVIILTAPSLLQSAPRQSALNMGTRSASARLSLLGVMLLWPYVLPRSVLSSLQAADSSSPSAGQGGQRPHLVKRATQMCDSTFDSYCMNAGQCMLLVDINEHHCKCERGFYGPRCSQLELVVQPLGEEQIIVTIFCVVLLIVGLAGLLYFFYKWYKKNKFQKRQGYKGVQTA
nr:proepiregulin-like isoform X1 [Gasterosteus aculeatus aculeatus]